MLSVILSLYWTNLSSLGAQYKTTFLVSLFASILAALGLSLLLSLEHQRSHRASDIATLYLLGSILCDTIYLTMPSKITRNTNISRPFLLRCCGHVALLMLELCGKRPSFNAVKQHKSPEEIYGILGRVFLIWINPILVQGYKNILTDQDSPSLSQDMKPEVTRNAMIQTWSQRG